MRALALLLILLAAPAHAEWYADIYGGAAYTPHSDMTLVVGSPSGPADHVFHDVKWNQSTELGMRAGYWFDSLPWYGVGLDAFHFDANAPGQAVDLTIGAATAPATLQAIDVSASVVAFDVVRLRYPLMASGEYPRGRLQPYASAGPALFRVHVTNKANGELTTQPTSRSATRSPPACRGNSRHASGSSASTAIRTPMPRPTCRAPSPGRACRPGSTSIPTI